MSVLYLNGTTFLFDFDFRATFFFRRLYTNGTTFSISSVDCTTMVQRFFLFFLLLFFQSRLYHNGTTFFVNVFFGISFFLIIILFQRFNFFRRLYIMVQRFFTRFKYFRRLNIMVQCFFIFFLLYFQCILYHNDITFFCNSIFCFDILE